MAISSTHADLLRRLKPILPRGGSLLEIGEANWYGDIAPDFPCPPTTDLHDIAKAFYADLFAPSRIVSVDMNGTPAAWRCDLNAPLPPLGLFDVVINHGTAEHVFNIAQVFASMHNACKVGGLMIHEAPFTGWIDHGFYCLQPTLFYDLAAVNGYEIVSIHRERLLQNSFFPVNNRDEIAESVRDGTVANNEMLFVVFRKRAAEPFKIPAQGYYSSALSDAGKEAWEKLR